MSKHEFSTISNPENWNDSSELKEITPQEFMKFTIEKFMELEKRLKKAECYIELIEANLRAMGGMKFIKRFKDEGGKK